MLSIDNIMINMVIQCAHHTHISSDIVTTMHYNIHNSRQNRSMFFHGSTGTSLCLL